MKNLNVFVVLGFVFALAACSKTGMQEQASPPSTPTTCAEADAAAALADVVDVALPQDRQSEDVLQAQDSDVISADVVDASIEDASDASDASANVVVDAPDANWWRYTSHYVSPNDDWIIVTDLDFPDARRDVVEMVPVPEQWWCRSGQPYCSIPRHYDANGEFRFIIVADNIGWQPGHTCRELIGTRVQVFNHSTNRPPSFTFPVEVETEELDRNACAFIIRRTARELPAPSWQDYGTRQPAGWAVVVNVPGGTDFIQARWEDGAFCQTVGMAESLRGVVMPNVYRYLSCAGAAGNRTFRLFTGLPGGNPCEGAGFTVAAYEQNSVGGRPIPPPRILHSTTLNADSNGMCTYTLVRP